MHTRIAENIIRILFRYVPQSSMDRDKAYIPALQIKFMDSIAVPVYK